MRDLFKLILMINVIWGVIILEVVNIWVFGINGQIFILILIIICLAGGIELGAILKGREIIK